MSTGSSARSRKSLIGMATALVERARRRGAGRHGRADRAARRRPQDRQRRARACARRARACRSIVTCCASPNRIGIADSDDPVKVEAQLCGALPPERWTRASDTLILHGRRICRPKPLCDRAMRAGLRLRSVGLRHVATRAATPQRGRRPPKRRDHAVRLQTGAESDMTREQFARSSPKRSTRFPQRFARRDPEPRHRRRGRAVATSCSPRWRSSRPTRCSGCIRARR